MSPCRTIASSDERRGEDDRRQEQHGVAHDRPLAPGAGRQDVQADDQVGRREGEELERREERGQDAGQQDARADGDPGTRRRAGRPSTSPGSPSVVARWGRNPVPKIDAILKYGQPSAQVLSYESRLTRSTTSPCAGDHVADQADPAQPAAEADEDRRDRGHPARRRSGAARAPRRRAPGRRRTARWSRSRPG